MIRLENILKISLQGGLEDFLKTFLQDVLKMSWKRLEDVLARRLEDVLETSWKRLEDLLKTYSQDEYIGLDQDGLKTPWRLLLESYGLGEYIHLDQDVLKMSSKGEEKDVFKTSSSRPLSESS